ncbi:MAG: competence/damage-inducible protein A [Paracoccaceae bacterium]
MDHSSLRTTGIIIIGNEILSGRTQDLNSRYLAQRLLTIGITVSEVRIIPDIKGQIINCVNEFRNKYTFVFTSGGIGPTHDDITAECIASAFNVDLQINRDAKKLLENYYISKNVTLNSSRLRMARIPKGADMIPNPISIAPGFQIQNVFVLAGIPSIFKAMVENVIKNLEAEISIKSKTITVNKAEGDIADKLSMIASQYPDVSIGSYPFENGSIIGTNIVISHHDEKMIKKIAKFTEALK